MYQHKHTSCFQIIVLSNHGCVTKAIFLELLLVKLIKLNLSSPIGGDTPKEGGRHQRRVDNSDWRVFMYIRVFFVQNNSLQ